MKILICNERFTFRFGVDRVLILLAQGLKKKGHKIGIAANRADSEVIAQLTETYFEIPQSGCPYIDLNEFTAEWLRKQFDSLPAEDLPDVALIGGWPFLAAIPVFLSKGIRVVFHDFGVVPLDAYSGDHVKVLQKLQTLRRQFIPLADLTIAISSFIKNTQSTGDTKQPNRTAVGLLGADHMSLQVWKSNEQPTSSFDSAAIAELREHSLEQQRPMSILNLGRWEPGCYKNSEAVFELVDKATEKGVSVVVFVLADRVTTMMPIQYLAKVIPVGFPDDAELAQLMEQCDLGISTSLWEGFNLPLAEMQWCGKPVLVFNAGAHPEVVAHPWQLCRDIDEMVGKVATLQDEGVASIPRWPTFLDMFRKRFRWEHVIDHYERLLVQAEDRRRSRLFILIDVTNAARDTANSGVIRVTRRISRELQEYCRPIFVMWDSSLKEYVFPNRHEYSLLSQYNGPDVSNEVLISPDGARLTLDAAKLSIDGSLPWLLLTETVMEAEGQHIRPYARYRGFALAAVFYDAIPVLRPDLVKDITIRDNHALYMRGLAKCDLVLPISEFSASCLHSFWEQEKLKGHRVEPLPLPGEFAAALRYSSDQARSAEDSDVHILCVSTLEPRKNHLRLLASINKFATKNPDIRWTLTLVGNRYAGAEDIAARVQTVCAKDKRIRWLGVVDDERLTQEYQRCSFTVYASEIEGFGMPVLESLWFGKPVLCHNKSILAELAVDGGCLTIDMTNEPDLVNALETLVKSANLRAKLSSEAQSRSIKRWDSYIAEVWDALCASVVIIPNLPYFLERSPV